MNVTYKRDVLHCNQRLWAASWPLAVPLNCSNCTLLVGKMSSKKKKKWGWKSLILGEFRSRTKILSSYNLLCRKFATFSPAPHTFSNPRHRWLLSTVMLKQLHAKKWKPPTNEQRKQVEKNNPWKELGELWSTNKNNHPSLWSMTLKFNRFLEVVKVHVHAKFHQAECSGPWVIVSTNCFALSHKGKES